MPAYLPACLPACDATEDQNRKHREQKRLYSGLVEGCPFLRKHWVTVFSRARVMVYLRAWA